MDVIPLIVVIIAGLACATAVWAFIETAKAMRSFGSLSDDLRSRLNPLLEKADVTVDAVNAELLRIDAIVTRFEDASERVSSASGTIHGIVNAPTELVSEMALRVRRAWRDRHREPATPPDTGATLAEEPSPSGEGSIAP